MSMTTKSSAWSGTSRSTNPGSSSALSPRSALPPRGTDWVLFLLVGGPVQRRPQKREVGISTVRIAASESVALRTRPSRGLAERVRSWLRFAHTGEVYYGFVRQTVAGVASAGAMV